VAAGRARVLSTQAHRIRLKACFRAMSALRRFAVGPAHRAPLRRFGLCRDRACQLPAGQWHLFDCRSNAAWRETPRRLRPTRRRAHIEPGISSSSVPWTPTSMGALCWS